MSDQAANVTDPRTSLAEWANRQDEWVRFVVQEVLSTGRPLTTEGQGSAYALFRQEKALEARVLPEQAMLAIEPSADAAELPLMIERISEVTGVNALILGEVIEPHPGLTILFGENGTGKTGYSRVLKALAGSRTADVILGDIAIEVEQPQSAKIDYSVGSASDTLVWAGEQGKAPFTRMSIFDSPSVNFHVDEDLEYVYTPAALALFNHVSGAIRAVQAKIDDSIAELSRGTTTLLSRFPKDSTVYPLIETLGAATDIVGLKAIVDDDPKADERIEVLRRSVASLEANSVGAQIVLRQRHERVLTQAASIAALIEAFDVAAYNQAVSKRDELRKDYADFRVELFQAADLPAEPDATWEGFVRSGESYREHLEEHGALDADRCLYCRQPLGEKARSLIGKYGEYLADKINDDIEAVVLAIEESTGPLTAAASTEMSAFEAEYADQTDVPKFKAHVTVVADLLDGMRAGFEDERRLPVERDADVVASLAAVATELTSCTRELTVLREQDANRVTALADEKRKLSELIAASELAKGWTQIEAQVAAAKEADRLRLLVRPFPSLSRAVTELAKASSDELVNNSFDKLFSEECAALRAPSLKLQFVGRQGRAQRRKVLSGRHKPSKVLSEGEQKVLAMADFLAEARLAGITAPVVFDDPVSSLDHRRISEVAERVAVLAETSQVIVFTHDILFATKLLSLFEKSKRCVYYQITDDDGKGKITRATGPRWDTLATMKKHINETITAARASEGEARASLVRTGYGWLRSWCEVFTETELLQGVTQRYQPNVGMTRLPNIKVDCLPDSIDTVVRIFEDACRFIEAHSQPLVTLGVSPTLPGLEAHWQELQDCKRSYDAA